MRHALLSCLAAGTGALAAHPTVAQVPASPLERLDGCWHAAGVVEGMAADSTLTVEPRLGGLFHLFRLSSIDRSEAYDAEITVGMTDGGVVRAFWSDTFGPAGAAGGSGELDGDALVIDYPYTDATFRNRIEPVAQGAWRWTIDAVEGETARPFAAYMLTPMPCPAGAAD